LWCERQSRIRFSGSSKELGEKAGSWAVTGSRNYVAFIAHDGIVIHWRCGRDQFEPANRTAVAGPPPEDLARFVRSEISIPALSQAESTNMIHLAVDE
jgi:hypothetical protein